MPVFTVSVARRRTSLSKQTDKHPPKTAEARPDAMIVTALLTGLVAFGPISTDLYLPALPALARSFATDYAAAQLTLSVFLAGFAAGMLVYGPLSDRFGRRPLILAGTGVFVLGSIACALAWSMTALIAFRFVQALGAACGPVLGRAVVRDVYGRERAAKVLAYMAMAMALAPTIGPIVGGVLTQLAGWRLTFWVLAAFGATILVGIAVRVGETNPHKDPAATRPRQLMDNYAGLIAHRAYIGYVLATALTYSGIFAFISGSSTVFIDTLGLSPTLYGACFAAVVVGYMIGSFASGRLTLRLGIERMVRLGTSVSLVAALIFAGLSWTVPPSVGAIVLPYCLFMVGAGLTLPNAQAGAIGPFPAMAGLASSLLGFIQMFVAALVGIGVGQATDGTARPMAFALAVVTLGAALAGRRLIGPTRN